MAHKLPTNYTREQYYAWIRKRIGSAFVVVEQHLAPREYANDGDRALSALYRLAHQMTNEAEAVENKQTEGLDETA